MARRRLWSLATLLASVAAVLGTLAPTASAAGTPPWEPDPNTVGQTGTLTFYNASGDAVTGGSNIDHLFDYALASSDDPGTTKGDFANLEFANPTPGQDPANWPVVADESSQASNATAPNGLGAATAPLVTLDSGGAELHAAIGSFTANTTPGYQNVYQVRLYTTGPNSTGTGAGLYWAADVQVTGTGAGATWTEVYPVNGAAPTSTSTTLTANPANSATQHQSVTFTATETGADTTHPAGTVQFFDGNQFLGSPVPVDANGVATATTSTLLPGNHTIKAAFTPGSASYSPAPLATLAYLVNPVAAQPTISGTVQVGRTVTCNEPSTAGESVAYAWKIGTTKIGAARTLNLPGSAAGKTLTCTVTVTVPGGTPSSATSVGKKVALGAALKATGLPVLTGKGRVGTVETCSRGRWSPAATNYSYQWYRGTSAIRGATHATYRMVRADRGKKLSCRVTAHKAGYANGVARSHAITVR